MNCLLGGQRGVNVEHDLHLILNTVVAYITCIKGRDLWMLVRVISHSNQAKVCI
jgi:hypothetical protein